MIKLYNTLHKNKEDFKPIDLEMVKIYSCGPTVYSEPHIGNIRYFWFCSLLRNTLQYIGGYNVTHVMNITDVGHLTDDGDNGEDKMEKGARREGKTARDVAELYGNKFMAILNQLDIHFEYNPKATDYIQEQIDMIIALEKAGHTYIIADDGVYFDTSTMADYGSLVGQKHLNGLQSGARIENDHKRNITDFALWKFNTTCKKRDMERESPRGIGFPGRHIECSAMSKKLLGNHFDIHTGGIDHIPVHHTNEIAQSECGGCDTPRVNYRMHTQFLNVDGQKISKSLGNDIYIRDILTKGYMIEDLRMFFLTAHYRSFQDFTWEGMEMARKRRENLKKNIYILTKDIDFKIELAFDKLNPNLISGLADDLNTSASLASFSNLNLDNIHTAFYLDKYIYKLGLFDFDALDDIENEDNLTEIPEEIEELFIDRTIAKINKDYMMADKLRIGLESKGWNPIDTKDSFSQLDNQKILYTIPGTYEKVNVFLKDEIIWINQKHMAEMFGINSRTINEHIQNIYKQGELEENGTTRKNRVVQNEGNRQINREVKFYNLDMIISVGYRVNSTKATQFRIRATTILKQYIYNGHALNEYRLQQLGVDDVKKSLEIISRAITNIDLTNDESLGLAKLMTIYIPSLITLNQFDSNNLQQNDKLSDEQRYKLDANNANQILSKLKYELINKGEATELFAIDRNDGLGSIFGNIYQSFSGEDLYPSIIHKASNLFYMIIKNHPFVDGNKRSAAFLLVRYLSQNNLLVDKDGNDKINKQTLVAITILIAISDPKEKELMIKLIINLIG